MTNRVIFMCSTNNFIEQEAYVMSQQIRKETVFKCVKVIYSEGNNPDASTQILDSQDYSTVMEPALITKVILEDKDGTLYYVEPNPNGLRFAKGEISYNEYKNLQRKETINVFAIFFGIIVFFSGSMFTFIKYLT